MALLIGSAYGLALVWLDGTEALTFSLGGTIAIGAAKARLGRELEPDAEGDRVRVELVHLDLRGLGIARAPLPRLSYGEALWRVAARAGDRRGWLVVACDLDGAAARALAATFVRYPVRAARFEVDDGADFALVVRASEGRIALSGRAAGAPTTRPGSERAMWVASGGELFEVPWVEAEAAWSPLVIDVTEDTLGARTFGAPVAWSAEGARCHGRKHCCGTARRVSG